MANFLDLFAQPFGLPPLPDTLDLSSVLLPVGGPKLNLALPSGGPKLQTGAAWESAGAKLTPPPKPQTAPTAGTAAGCNVPAGLPAEVQPLLQEAAQASGLDPSLLAAVWQQESGLQHYSAPGVVKTSPAGAIGLGQLMPDTARGL